MEQILIEAGSENTAAAIKEFVSRFADASVSVQEVHDDSFCQETSGIDNNTFENNLNIGLAQSVLGITKPWNEVKEALY
jgi:hypothetical protein